MLLIPLHRRERNVTIVLCRQLMRVGPRTHTTFTTVVANASHVDVVDHGLVVDVGDMYATEVRN